MRIAVISSTVFSCPPVGYSGLEFIAWQIAKGLATKGHQVTLIAPDGSHCEGCQVVCTGPPGGHHEGQAYGGWKGRDVYGREMLFPDYWRHLLNQDAIIDHSWLKHSYMLKAEGKLKAPILGVCHAPVDTMFKQWPPQWPGFPPIQKACPVCISEDQRQHFEALFNTPARVAYNGVDLDFYKPIEGVRRGDRFLFLGRFSSVKSPHLAIEACLKAEMGLDLIGDTSITNEPDYLKKCMDMCDWTPERIKASTVYSRKPRDKWIRFVGPATRSECVWWFSQAFALIHPVKNFREPFGLAPVEAQACECPVIAWNNGAMRETVSDSYTGRLVSSEEELVDTIKYCKFTDPVFDNKAANVWRNNCRTQATKFSIHHSINRYEQLCIEAINGGW